MTAGGIRFYRKAGLIAAAAAAAAVFGVSIPASAQEEAPPRPTIRIGSSTLEPADWSRMDGWADDDHLAGFNTFMASCKAILRQGPSARADRPVFRGLHRACEAATEAQVTDAKAAREFFEREFRPVRITPLGEAAGFLTGYYEPIVEGSLEPSDEYAHPLYRTPAGLLRGGKRLKTASFKRGKGKATAAAAAKTAKTSKTSTTSKASKATKSARVASAKVARTAKATRKGGGRRLVSFFDRAAIEDGVLKGRNLEIAYLKDPVDSFFIHIQGSARVRLPTGNMLRVNYDSQNGHPYVAVGRFLIDRKIVTKEEMSMERIRQWMTANPEEGKELRRLNKSYVFFRETGLAADIEPIGAQGVSLTPGRSIAVDRNLHVYGTPFFIQSELPIDSDQPTTRWRRLMVAQDTGGAIIGPARADIYYGAGEPAGQISGRFKQPGQFVMLFPKSVDPFPVQREVPLPKARPGDIPQDETPEAKLEAPIAAPASIVKEEAAKIASIAHVPVPPPRPASLSAAAPAAAAPAPVQAKPADAPAAASIENVPVPLPKPAALIADTRNGDKPAAKRPKKSEAKPRIPDHAPM